MLRCGGKGSGRQRQSVSGTIANLVATCSVCCKIDRFRSHAKSLMAFVAIGLNTAFFFVRGEQDTRSATAARCRGSWSAHHSVTRNLPLCVECPNSGARFFQVKSGSGDRGPWVLRARDAHTISARSFGIRSAMVGCLRLAAIATLNTGHPAASRLVSGHKTDRSSAPASQ